jgi:hypothetical protein
MNESPGVPPAHVAERAYFIWESEGRPERHALDHWLRAEAELTAAAAAPAKRRTAKRTTEAKTTQADPRKKTASKPSGTRPRTRRPRRPSSSP